MLQIFGDFIPDPRLVGTVFFLIQRVACSIKDHDFFTEQKLRHRTGSDFSELKKLTLPHRVFQTIALPTHAVLNPISGHAR